MCLVFAPEALFTHVRLPFLTHKFHQFRIECCDIYVFHFFILPVYMFILIVKKWTFSIVSSFPYYNAATGEVLSDFTSFPIWAHGLLDRCSCDLHTDFQGPGASIDIKKFEYYIYRVENMLAVVVVFVGWSRSNFHLYIRDDIAAYIHVNADIITLSRINMDMGKTPNHHMIRRITFVLKNIYRLLVITRQILNYFGLVSELLLTKTSDMSAEDCDTKDPAISQSQPYARLLSIALDLTYARNALLHTHLGC
ncbi:hypothetical protein ACJX0J_032523, partial [Zea mays]